MQTNKAAAERIGLTHSTVSRIRHGHRMPSFATMQRIEAETGWKIADQMQARVEGTYAKDFRTRVLGESTAPAAAAH